MAALDGYKLIVKNNSVQVDNLMDVSLTLNKQVIEVTTKDSNYWREILPSIRSASLSFTAVVDYTASEGWAEIYADYVSQTAVSWEFTTDDTGDSTLSGSAHITSIEKTGPMTGAAQYSVTMEVTGAITIGTEA